MKIQRLETHDRLSHLIKDQALNIAKGCEDCLNKNSLSLALQQYSPYIYIFAHPRTAEDGVTKEMYWQPRLYKPKAETNSYLFRALSKTDTIEICWMIPPEEHWGQHKKGNLTESEIVTWSINQYKYNRKKLEKSEDEDLSEDQGRNIYRKAVLDLIQESKKFTKPEILAASSSLILPESLP